MGLSGGPTEKTSVAKRRPRREIGLPWSLLLIPALFIFAGLCIPYMALASLVMLWRERAFSKQMAGRSRVMGWPDFRQALEQRRGTVIVERYSFAGPVRWWWTQDQVSDVCPYPIVDWFQMTRHARYRPLVDWFRQRYTGAEGDGARLVDREGVPKDELKAVFAELESESTNVRRIEVAPPEAMRRVRRCAESSDAPGQRRGPTESPSEKNA